MKKILGVVLAISMAWSNFIFADTLQLRDDFPEVYIVKKGDTLWDISSLYLRSPWLWPRLWQANSQIENPHLIYPGDRLSLIYVDGEPRLVSKRVVKMGPSGRIKPKESAIPTLPLSAIKAFINKDHITDPEMYLNSPYVLGDNEAQTRLVGNRTAYAHGDLELGRFYGIYRGGEIYIDPETKEVLGQSMSFLGVAVVEKNLDQDINQLSITQYEREIRLGDRLLPVPKEELLPAYFSPQPGHLDGHGLLLANANDISVASVNDVIIINKGERDGLEPGHVFAINQPGREVLDTSKRISYLENGSAYDKLFSGDTVKKSLPDEKVGELMIFKVYEKTAYAFVIESKTQIRLHYQVKNL
ncbi:LysM domain-containing protein [Alginatibacterium sediminis]|uniref:LysM domain-containing protein n=1 Tax=Alginatibacterium sediminis TaxID=2164068 RepID=A0A420ENN2_9ALTE|nr:LysM domain-containing protein [Alginatibacterium sediminis]RKF22196.1 LysM domain-containing protein [Alginatibacterium sediminis]